MLSKAKRLCLRVSKFTREVENLITAVSYGAAALSKPFQHAFQKFSGCVSIHQRQGSQKSDLQKRVVLLHF